MMLSYLLRLDYKRKFSSCFEIIVKLVVSCVLMINMVCHSVLRCNDVHDFTANLVLQNAVERTFSGQLYIDQPQADGGIYLIRGENVILMGEVVRAL